MGVEMEGLVDLTSKLDTMGETIRRKVRDIIARAAFRGARVAIERLRQKTSGFGEGLLRQTIDVVKKPSMDDLEAIVSAGGKRTTMEEFDYALAVEFGTRPHFPPVKALTGELEPLDLWVKRMGPSAQTEAQQNLTQEELNEQVAFLIARKISRVGTKEKPFMRPGFNIARAKARKDMQRIDLSG